MRLLIVLVIIFNTLLASDMVIKGDVEINGKKATANMKVKLGDFIQTGKKSKVMFTIGKDAFLVKSNSKFRIKQEKKGIRTLNVITGGVLGVFKKGSQYDIKSNNMVAGIRGTGIYIESVDKKSYFCTCYGKTHVYTNKEQVTLTATHHNMVWIKPDGSIKATKEMRNHTDDELREIEKMVGRIPQFDQEIDLNSVLSGNGGY